MAPGRRKPLAARRLPPAAVAAKRPKGPLYKRPWFVAIMVILLLGAVGSACGDSDDSQPGQDAIQQEQTTVQEDAGSQEETAVYKDTAMPRRRQPPRRTHRRKIPPRRLRTRRNRSPYTPLRVSRMPRRPTTPTKARKRPSPSLQRRLRLFLSRSQSRSRKPEPAQETSRTVYITKTGKRYHYDGNCGNGEYIPSTLAEAEARGLTPCEKCAGG